MPHLLVGKYYQVRAAGGYPSATKPLGFMYYLLPVSSVVEYLDVLSELVQAELLASPFV